MNLNYISNRENQIRRIGLLSPYSGGNLGNAAIISAVIANARKRIPHIEILGITLNPDHTRRRHGIQAFPLVGISRPYYFLCDSDSTSGGGRQVSTGRHQKIKQWLKHVPLVGSSWRTIRMLSKELIHVITAAGVVRKLDRLVITGGGALDEFWGGPWGQPWSLAKWSLLSRVCRVPVLFVSVGKCSLERPLSRWFVRISLRVATYRSYRDRQSRIAVEALLHEARKDPVYPDLAFSYPCLHAERSSETATSDDRLTIGVSPIAFCDPRSWPLADERRYAAYLNQLATIVRWLANERHRVRFFATDSPDVLAIVDLQTMLANSSAKGSQEIVLSPADQMPDIFLKAIKHCDLIIASRLHGVILSHLSAIPVLAISYDPKVDAQMSSVGHEKYCLNIDHLSPSTLVQCFTDLSLARQREAARLRDATLLFRRQLELQYDQILGVPHAIPVTSGYGKQIDPLAARLQTQ